MSWESSTEYYRPADQRVAQRLGRLHSAPVLLTSVAFADIEELQRAGDRARAGADVLVPTPADRALVHRVIHDELCGGVVSSDSQAAYRAVIGRLVAAGAGGIVLGRTEIELLAGPADSPVPVFPTTRLHIEAAVEDALG